MVRPATLQPVRNFQDRCKDTGPSTARPSVARRCLMHGTERRQYEMLVRVRKFGEANQALLDSSPVARQTVATVGSVVDELRASDMKKMAASASVRAGRREAARHTLLQLLQNIVQLARNLTAEGRTLPPFDLPNSKSAQALLTAGRQFAVDVAPFDADFGGHGLSAAFITKTTDVFEAAVNDQGMSRADRAAAIARIRELLAAGTRGARRLDLIVQHDLAPNTQVQAPWQQLRRIEDPRGSRGGSEPHAVPSPATSDKGEPAPAEDAGPPAPPPA